MPHMANLPWVEIYSTSFLMMLALNCQLVGMQVTSDSNLKSMKTKNNKWTW